MHLALLESRYCTGVLLLLNHFVPPYEFEQNRKSGLLPTMANVLFLHPLTSASYLPGAPIASDAPKDRIASLPACRPAPQLIQHDKI
jgi:hypothetical protein